MARQKTCPRCFGERHEPNCPEMSFPSGLRRDDPGSEPGWPPPYNPARAAEIPASSESPLTLELSRIFAGVERRLIPEDE